MRFGLILASVAVMAGGIALTGCSVDPIDIPQSEYYARQFYKTFGSIAANQDWTAATRGEVTVVTAKPTTVRIIADVDGKTYLFGQYADIEGEKTLSFDLPKNAGNVELVINGRHYAITNGSVVDFTRSSRGGSRALGGIDPDTHLGESGTYAGVQVTIEENQKGRYLTLEPDIATEALKRLEENPSQVSSWSETNLDVVTDNFSATAKEFYLFPEYWQTAATSKNIIGIYWEVPAGTEGAEEITRTDVKGVEHTYYVVRVPFLQDPSLFMIPCTSNVISYRNFSDIPNWDDIFERLCKRYPDTYYVTDGTQKDQYGNPFPVGQKNHKYSDGVDRTLTQTSDGEWSDYGHEVCKDIIKMYPTFYIHEWGILAENELVENPYTDTPGESLVTNAQYYKSKGIHVKFDSPVKFGFYIQQGDNVMFSQTKLNECVTKLDADGNEETRQPSYVATFKNGVDTEGNDKRHLCFEDWYEDNWDLNDMVFRVYGFDNIVTRDPDPDPEDPDEPFDPGKVHDEDDPDPDPDPDPTTEEYPAYPWIIACEDLGASDDFDFNDIVFGVEHVAGTTDVYVTALAAGGTLPARLYYTLDGSTKVQIVGGVNDESTAGNQYTISSPYGGKTFEEWHKWFGNYDSSEMINTGGNVKRGATVRITLSLSDAEKFSLSNDEKEAGWNTAAITHLGGFTVEVDQISESGSVTTREIKAPFRSPEDNPADNIPQLFATNHKYNWPAERVSINTTHAGNGNIVGQTPQGVKYAENSFMHWVVAGDVAKFHDTAPSNPGMTCKHGWTGDVKHVKITKADGTVIEYDEAYGNKYNVKTTVSDLVSVD